LFSARWRRRASCAAACRLPRSVSCVHHEMSCWPPSMSYVAPVSAVLLMM
jgi:hypothetical protein